MVAFTGSHQGNERMSMTPERMSMTFERIPIASEGMSMTSSGFHQIVRELRVWQCLPREDVNDF